MAILGEPIPWVRKEAYEGVFYTRRWRGKRVTSSWPRRRKRRRAALQRQKETDFAAAVLAIKWMDPTIVGQYIDRAKPTQTLWRDALMSQIYGTAFALTSDEMLTIYPQQFWLKVSNSLDKLGFETGALLVRGSGQWQTIAPAAAGLVLTSGGPDTLPTWT